MGKKLFWSRDRLVKHEFDYFGLHIAMCLRVLRSRATASERAMVRANFGLRLRLELWLGIVVRDMNSFGVMVRVRVGIRLTDVTRLNFFEVARAAFFSKY